MTSMVKTFIKRFLIFTFTTLITITAYAERMGINGYDGISIDFPEGFQVVDVSSDKKTFQLYNSELSVNCIVKTYPKSSFGTSQRALDDTINKLKLTSKSTSCLWRNLYCSFSSISGKINNDDVTGMAESICLPYEKGYIILIAWCNKTDYKLKETVIESIMDSISIDQGSYMGIGPYTTSKYAGASKSVKKISLEIDGKKINTQIHLQDIAQAQYVVEREYKVLTMYQKSKKWQEAWTRYYRMIFKDSYERLERCSFDIYNSISSDCTDETDLAQKLLYWTQNFKYEREKTASDFTCLPGIIAGMGSDCDGRSLLLAVLLTHMNQDCVIFVSATHSHAMAGFVSTHPGRSFDWNGKKYLMGETTSKGVTWGMIAQDMSNQKDWLTITFP